MTEITTTQGGAMSLPTWMRPETLDQALAMADRIASSGLMPDHLAGNPGGVLMIMDQAQRWGMSPLAVAQATSIVRGKLCYEGKLVHAALISMGAIKGCLSYEYDGKEDSDSRTVKVTGILADGKERSITGSAGAWKTTGGGSPWKAGAYDKMLAYRGTREWARMYAPAAMLGVQTPDEVIVEADDVVVHDDLSDPPPARSPQVESGEQDADQDGEAEHARDMRLAIDYARRTLGDDEAIAALKPIADRVGVKKLSDTPEELQTMVAREIYEVVEAQESVENCDA